MTVAAPRPIRPGRPTRARFSASARPIPPVLARGDAAASHERRPAPRQLAGRLRTTATGFALAVLLALGALLLGLGPVAAAVAICAVLIAVAVGGAVLVVERLTRTDDCNA